MMLFELRLMLHSRLARAALLLFFALAALSVVAGCMAVQGQRDALARVEAAHRQDSAALLRKHGASGDAGANAYALPHLTTNPPSALAFAAFGQRDMQAIALRVRLLGLQAQLYESNQANPEMVMPGRFDFAFVLVYLAPLFIIALMHDLVSAERDSRRLGLLASLPQARASLWWRRIAVRFLMVALACLLPLAAGLALAGVDAAMAAAVALTALLYLGFWCALAAMVAMRVRSGAASAAILLASLVTLTMIVPTVAQAVIARQIPVSKGIELALAQRQEVHQGWDLPKGDTFGKFFRTHPEWKDTPPVTGRFHWKWYFAMHQAGDDAVAARAAGYRDSMLARERLTGQAAYLLPSVAVQVLLHRVAGTDLQAHQDYLERIAAFHAQLRKAYYPYIFNEQPFGEAQFASLPRYQAGAPAPQLPFAPLLALALMTLAACAAGLRQAGRMERL